MPSIHINKAKEKLARAAEGASSDNLVEIYGELFPEKVPPKASAAITLVGEIASYIRTKIEPEELVDLWNVVFPTDRVDYYDEVEGVVIYNQEEPWYADR